MKRETVKPIPARRDAPRDVGSRDAVGEAASAEAEAGEGGHADTDELSRNEPEDDPPGDARTEGVAKRVGRHLDAGVGEGKEGHDKKA